MNKNYLKTLAMFGLATGVLLTTQEGEAAYRRSQGSYVAQNGCGNGSCGGAGSAYDDGYYQQYNGPNNAQYQQNRNWNNNQRGNNPTHNPNWKINPQDENNVPNNNNNNNGRDDPYAKPSYPSTYSQNSFQPQNQRNRNIATNDDLDENMNDDDVKGNDYQKKPTNRTKQKQTLSQKSPYKKINNRYYRNHLTDADDTENLDDDSDLEDNDDLDSSNNYGKKPSSYSKPASRNLNNSNSNNLKNTSTNGAYRYQNGNSSLNGTNGNSR